jgi:hypothetical protein
MSECCSTLAILKIVYCGEFCIEAKPSQYDEGSFQEWKSKLRELANDVMLRFNENMALIDRKKATSKASGVRNRFERCHQSSPEFASLIRMFSTLRVQEKVVDKVTPVELQKEGNKLVKYLPLIAQIQVDSNSSFPNLNV